MSVSRKDQKGPVGKEADKKLRSSTSITGSSAAKNTFAIKAQKDWLASRRAKEASSYHTPVLRNSIATRSTKPKTPVVRTDVARADAVTKARPRAVSPSYSTASTRPAAASKVSPVKAKPAYRVGAGTIVITRTGAPKSPVGVTVTSKVSSSLSKPRAASPMASSVYNTYQASRVVPTQTAPFKPRAVFIDSKCLAKEETKETSVTSTSSDVVMLNIKRPEEQLTPTLVDTAPPLLSMPGADTFTIEQIKSCLVSAVHRGIINRGQNQKLVELFSSFQSPKPKGDPNKTPPPTSPTYPPRSPGEGVPIMAAPVQPQQAQVNKGTVSVIPAQGPKPIARAAKPQSTKTFTTSTFTTPPPPPTTTAISPAVSSTGNSPAPSSGNSPAISPSMAPNSTVFRPSRPTPMTTPMHSTVPVTVAPKPAAQIRPNNEPKAYNHEQLMRGLEALNHSHEPKVIEQYKARDMRQSFNSTPSNDLAGSFSLDPHASHLDAPYANGNVPPAHHAHHAHTPTHAWMSKATSPQVQAIHNVSLSSAMSDYSSSDHEASTPIPKPVETHTKPHYTIHYNGLGQKIYIPPLNLAKMFRMQQMQG